MGTASHSGSKGKLADVRKDIHDDKKKRIQDPSSSSFTLLGTLGALYFASFSTFPIDFFSCFLAQDPHMFTARFFTRASPASSPHFPGTVYFLTVAGELKVVDNLHVLTHI